MIQKYMIISLVVIILIITTYFLLKYLKNKKQPQTQTLIPCGNSNCKKGEDCIQLSNINSDTYNKLINTKGSEITSYDNSSNSITFCHSPSSNLTVQNALPASIQDNYPYYNFTIPTGDKVGLCIPNSATSTDTTCFDKSKTDCTGSCQWTVLPDSYDNSGGLVDTQVKNYMNYKMPAIQGTQGTQGYYCDPGTLSLGKVTQINSTNWKDCISQLSNQGIIDANWDDTNKICNLFQIPPYKNNSNQPIQKIKCNASGSPCPNCKSDTDFVNAVRCTGTGTPCANCKQTGDYICDTCQPPTNTNGWNFTTCAPNDSNGNAVQVVSYGSSSGSGNCPWGCSSVNGGGNCYNFDIPTGSSNIFGQPLSSTNDIVCMQDGQIHFEPKNQIIQYAFDQTQGICIESPSGSTSSICKCISEDSNLGISYKLGNFVAYIVVNNKKYYMYNDKDSFYKFTNNINDNILSGGNITINDDGSVSINGDIITLKIPNTPALNLLSGQVYIPPNPPYSGKFQLAKTSTDTAYTYLPLSLVVVDINGNIFKIQDINFSPGQALTWFIPSSQQTIDSTWVNQTITDFLNLTPTDNYIHIVPFKLEHQAVNNNCAL